MIRTSGAECDRCDDARFVCEQHPFRVWPHEDCAGPGVPCPRCQESGTRPAFPEGWRTMASTLTRPNEPLWELRKGYHTIACELRYLGEWGVEAALFRDGRFYGGVRFTTRAEAVAFGEEERARHLAEARAT